MIINRIFSLSTVACISVCASDISPSTSPLSQKIIDVLERYRIQTDIDKESIGLSSGQFSPEKPPENPIGYDALAAKIQLFVDAKQKLRLFMVSFPFKSSNCEKKVLAQGVDLAERKSLEYLYQCVKALKAVYPYGVELIIFCDGIPFAEYRVVSDTEVKKYEADLKTLTEDMPEITLITSGDIEKKIAATNPREICQRIDTFGPSDVDAFQQIETDPKVRESYTTLLERFKLEFDSKKGRDFLAKKGGLDVVIKNLIAREMRMRNFIEALFPPSTYVRLTVHYSTDVSKKFGIRLSPTSLIMPYHGVLVEEMSGAWSIQFKKDIDLQHYEEASLMVNGLPCRYMRPRHH